MKSAFNIEQAALLTIDWIRSRLPRYPLIPVPHLARHTHLTSVDDLRAVPWDRSVMGSGLNRLGPPPLLAEMLRPNGQVGDLFQALERLRDSFLVLPDWEMFSQVNQALSTEALGALKAAKVSLGRQILAFQSSQTDLTVGGLGEFRRSALRESVEGLANEAQSYCRAFEAVDRLITTSTFDVLGQLIAFGSPRLMDTVGELDVGPGRFRTVTFTTEDFLFDAGGLVEIEHPLVQNVLQVSRTSLDFSRHSSRTTVEAIELPFSHGKFT